MSQLDLIAELRESRPVAPAELRERIRHIAAEAEEPAPRRRLTRRRSLVLVLAVAALAVTAGALIPRDGQRQASQPERSSGAAPTAAQAGLDYGIGASADLANAGKASSRAPSLEAAPTAGTSGNALAQKATIPPPSSNTAQKYSATLSLRLKDSAAVSGATNKALRIVAAMGGHPNTVNVDAERKDGAAYLVLKVPRARVQEAVQKLGALGTIVGANVSIQDLQAGIDTTGRTIARLKGQLAELREETQTEDVVAQVETLSDRIENLQRQNAATIRAAYFATVKLHMKTPEKAKPVVAEDGNGPLHGLGVAFTWLGIGAVYAIALGTPLLLLLAAGWYLARGLRRRREEALLGRA